MLTTHKHECLEPRSLSSGLSSRHPLPVPICCSWNFPKRNKQFLLKTMCSNQPLKEELLSMQEEDQELMRELLASGETGSLEFHPRMKALYEKHTIRMKEIIKEHGWPGFALVGEEGAEAAWLIVQNAALDKDFMKLCLSLLQESSAKGDVASYFFPYLQDKILTMSSKARIFSSQFDLDEQGVAHQKPGQDPRTVDEMREGFGLEPLHEVSKLK